MAYYGGGRIRVSYRSDRETILFFKMRGVEEYVYLSEKIYNYTF